MFGSQEIQDLRDYINLLQEHYLVIKQTFTGLRVSRWHLARLLLAQIWRDMPLMVAAVMMFMTTMTFASIFSAIVLRPQSLQKRGIPLVGKSKGKKIDFGKMLEDAVKKYPNNPYLIRAWSTEYVVFPSKCFDEVKKLPQTQASGKEYFRQMFHEPYSGIARHSSEFKKAVSVDLARAIPSFVRERQRDCAAAADSAIGERPDWKEVTLFSTLQEIVVRTNASAFVGRDLGTSKRWISTVEKLPLAVAIPTIIVSLAPALLRPLVRPLTFAPAVWMRRRLVRLLDPVLKEDIAEYEGSADKTALQGPAAKGKVALTSWLLKRYPAGFKNMYRQLTDDYVDVIFESTPSSAGTLFFILTELAADPELADMLREEIKAVAPDGQLPLTPLNELKKMDSVMRESARVNPFSYLVLYRHLMQPLKLSIGPELPAGTNICVDAYHINFDQDLWKDPEKFDGLRHYRARQLPGKENSFKFANLGRDSPGWGDGPQACPGRMYADNTLKIILTHLLTNYEFKLRPGEGKPRKGTMPNGSMYPDIRAKVLFKSRSGLVG